MRQLGTRSLRRAAATLIAILTVSGALAGCAPLPDPWRDAGRVAWTHIGSAFSDSRSCLDQAVQGDAGTGEEIETRVLPCFDTSVVEATPSQRMDGTLLMGNTTWLLDSAVTQTGLHVEAASVGYGKAVDADVNADTVLMACWTADLGPDRVWVVEGSACAPHLLRSVEGVAEDVLLKRVLRHLGMSNSGV